VRASAVRGQKTQKALKTFSRHLLKKPRESDPLKFFMDNFLSQLKDNLKRPQELLSRPSMGQRLWAYGQPEKNDGYRCG